MGAENRNFPVGENTRLGYVFETIESFNNLIPRIYISLSKTISDTIFFSYNIYIDGIILCSDDIIWSDYMSNIQIEVDELRLQIGHQIEIEISFARNMNTGEIIENNSVFTLEYLKVGGIDFWELDSSDVAIYSMVPTMEYVFNSIPDAYDSTMDDLPVEMLVAINSKTPMDIDTGLVGNHNSFNNNFRTGITIMMPEVDSPSSRYDISWWIDSVDVDWKIIMPDGSTLKRDTGNSPSNFFVEYCNNAYDYLETEQDPAYEILKTLGTIYSLGAKIASKFHPAAGLALTLTSYMWGFLASIFEPPEHFPPTEYKEIINNKMYNAWWRTGSTEQSPIANPALQSFSALYDWNSGLTGRNEDNGYVEYNGNYQVQMNWKVQVFYYNHYQGDSLTSAFGSVSGNYYINFPYINPYSSSS